MTKALTLTLHNRQQAWAALNGQVFPFLKEVLQSGHRWVLTLKLETRTQAQNRLMWPLLEAFSQQLQWPVDGQMVWMTADDWKDVLTAAFRRESVHLAMGLDGGVVMLGQRTSRFTKAEFSDWIEFLFATAAARGVALPAMADGWNE